VIILKAFEIIPDPAQVELRGERSQVVHDETVYVINSDNDAAIGALHQGIESAHFTNLSKPRDIDEVESLLCTIIQSNVV
jgi:hypothetical protein